MASKTVIKNSVQTPFLSFDNSIDVYIIHNANDFELVGVSYNGWDVLVTHEQNATGKTLFDILSTDFTNLYIDWEVREEQVVNGTPVISCPLFKENDKPQWWGNVCIPEVNTNGDTEFIIHSTDVVYTGHQTSGDVELTDNILFNKIELSEATKYERLMANEEKYRTLFETIEEGFCIIKMLFDEHNRSVDYLLEEVNPAFERITGFNDPEGKKMSELAPALESSWTELFGKVAKTRESVNTEQYAQPFDRYFDVHAFPVGKPDEQKVAVLFKDITSRKENEYTNALLGAIVNNSDDAIISKDLNGVVTSWNKSAERMFGYTAEEAIGKKITLIIPDERLKEEDEILRRLRNGERIDHFETVRERKDGSRLDISLTISPIKGSDGEIIGASKIARDITKRKETEEKLKKINQTLEERVEDRTRELQIYQQKLRSLASELRKAKEQERHNLATELHNNLGQMLTMAKMKLDETDTALFSDEASNNLNDLSKLLDDTLTYTRDLMMQLKPPPVLDKEDIKEILEWIVRQMKQYDLEVIFENDDKPKLLGEEERRTISQCVRELLTNVVKYANVNKAYLKLTQSNGKVKVTVEDEGKGFDKNDIGEFSNKGGFGLFNIREQMHWVGGSFDIISELGKGTKAMLSIPVKEKEQNVMSEDQETEKELSTNEDGAKTDQKLNIKILIADDHQMVRNGFRQMINKQDDMEVIGEAADGEETVKMARANVPDVILMDVNMPGMDGIEATKIITSEFPDICIIGLSLHDSDEVVENMFSAGASAYLSKDQAFKALVKTIRSEVEVS